MSNFVLYSDGSAKPNPGYIGYSVHGYSWSAKDDTNKKPKGTVPTQTGYCEASALGETAKENAVKPEYVYESIGTSKTAGTSSQAEVFGLNAALTLALKNNASSVLIKTDSDYACKGYNGYLQYWADNNWNNKQGKLINNLNAWQALYKTYKSIPETTKVTVEWVKAHSGEWGNETADRLATIARVSSMAAREPLELKFKADEYYKQSSNKHPLICKSWMYFRSNPDGWRAGEYYLGNIGKDAKFLGKRDPDGGYAIVYLKEPDALLEKIKNSQVEITGSNNCMFVVNLKAVYTANRDTSILRYGSYCLTQYNPRRKDLYFLDYAPDTATSDTDELDEEQTEEETEKEEEVDKLEPITREQYPPKLGFRVFDVLTVMHLKMQEYLAKDPCLEVIDITDSLYTKEKNKTHLSSSIQTGQTTLVLTLKSKLARSEVTMHLNLATDMPDRNTLKKIESMQPRVKLLLYKESDKTLRYMSVVETQDAKAIFAGYYTNYLFI